MSDATNIEWTDTTWNPVRGCSKVSPGCTNCYAERTAARQAHSGYAGLVRIGGGSPRWTGEVRLVEEKLDEPLRRRKVPRRVFVNSMSDLFHEKLTIEEIAAVFAPMALAQEQTFQVLTKRPARMKEWFAWAAAEWPKLHSLTAIAEMAQHGHGPDSNVVLTYARNARVLQHLERVGDDFAAPWPLPNVWLGVSVENQAAVRFLSVEPLLERVDLSRFKVPAGAARRIDWVIVGGESGPGARPCDVAWIRSVVEQCSGARVPCFVKQLGAVVHDRNDAGFSGHDEDAWPEVDRGVESLGRSEEYQGGACRVLLASRKGGDMAEWPLDLRVREFPEVRT